jgi:hypothetical protein
MNFEFLLVIMKNNEESLEERILNEKLIANKHYSF